MKEQKLWREETNESTMSQSPWPVLELEGANFGYIGKSGNSHNHDAKSV